MADENDEGLTARLLPEGTPLRTDEAARSHRLQWYHYIEAALLTLATLGALVISARNSVWTLLITTLTVGILLLSYKWIIYPHKPATIKTPFLITHATFGAIVAPLGVAVVEFVISIALIIPSAILFGVLAMVVAMLFPDDMEVVWDDFTSLSTNITDVMLKNSTGGGLGALSHLANSASTLPKVPANSNDTVFKEVMKEGWRKLTDDFLSTGGILFLICLFIFAIVAALALTVAKIAAIEYGKWVLFRRYKTVSIRGEDASVNVLGVSGLVFFACSGAFALSFGRALFRMYGFAYNGYTDLLTVFVIAAWTLVEAATLIGSQIVVAVARAEVVVLGKRPTMWPALRESGWLYFKVYITNSFIVLVGLPGNTVVKLIMLVVVTAVQMILVYRSTSVFRRRLDSALAEEAEEL